LTLAESKDDEKDEYMEVNGFKIIIDKELYGLYNSFYIDYVSNIFSKGFRVIPGARTQF
jgi:Fe-S cluster assembly iron-binding protein IscA